MSFDVSNYSPHRISIKTDMGAEARSVKVYKGLTADLACRAGFAKKIQDTRGNDYVINIRSLGKAWARDSVITKSGLSNKIKDTFAEKFFNQAEKDREFLKELNDVLRGDESGFLKLELRQLKNLPPRLNNPIDKSRIYNRIRRALLSDLPSKSEDIQWAKKVNERFPDLEGMGVKEFNKLVKILQQIDPSGNTPIKSDKMSMTVSKALDLGSLNPSLSKLKADIEIAWKPPYAKSIELEDGAVFEKWMKDLGHISNNHIFVGKDGKSVGFTTSKSGDLFGISIENNLGKSNRSDKCKIRFSDMEPNDVVQVINTPEKSVCIINRDDAKITLTYWLFS